MTAPEAPTAAAETGSNASASPPREFGSGFMLACQVALGIV